MSHDRDESDWVIAACSYGIGVGLALIALMVYIAAKSIGAIA